MDKEINYHDVVLNLEKLQEFEIIIKEIKILSNNIEKIREITAKMDVIKKGLPSRLVSHFEGLAKSNKLIVADVTESSRCSSCHISVAKGNVSRMKSSKMIPMCNSCSSFLNVW